MVRPLALGLISEMLPIEISAIRVGGERRKHLVNNRATSTVIKRQKKKKDWGDTSEIYKLLT